MTHDPTSTAGYLCNNPFDIFEEGIPWQGRLLPPHGRLCRFDTIDNGLRAGFIDLINGQRLHHRNTVRAIMTPYAPEIENDLEAYIKAVCAHLGVADDAVLTMTDLPTIRLFGEAVIHQEIGGIPYSDAQLARAVLAALVHCIPSKK